MSRGMLIERCHYADPRPIWNALAKHEAFTGAAHDVQDSFSFDAMRTLAFEPLAHPALHPENWKKLDAGLDLWVRLTAKGSLAIDVFPWKERRLTASPQEPFGDFVSFPGLDGAPCKIYELQLDELRSELRGASVHDDRAAVSKRRLVYLCYELVLQRLARHFSVRVQTALLCLGDNCRLRIRRMASLDNPVDSVRPWAANIAWHGNYLALCEQAAVAPDELLQFFKSSLATLTEQQRLGVLRQYLGQPAQGVQRRRRSRVPDDPALALLRALTVVASPDTFPPLADHPSERIEACLLQAISGVHNDRIGALAAHYCIDAQEIRQLLRNYYPKVLLETLVSAVDMRSELEHLIQERPEMKEVIAELQQRIMAELQRASDQFAPDQVSVRKRKLGKLCGFASYRALSQWTQQYAPAMASWLDAP